MGDRSIYQAPWREQLDDGTLSEHYGPSSPAAYARAVKRHQNWAWRAEGYSGPDDAEQVCSYVRRPDGTLRDDIPDGELQVYLDVYERGRSIWWVTRSRGVSHSTTRSYLRRLRARVAAGEPEAAPNRNRPLTE